MSHQNYYVMLRHGQNDSQVRSHNIGLLIQPIIHYFAETRFLGVILDLLLDTCSDLDETLRIYTIDRAIVRGSDRKWPFYKNRKLKISEPKVEVSSKSDHVSRRRSKITPKKTAS